ncbi:lysophospholipid acyltransferase family protein, partial [Nocardia salmonicida]
MFYWLLKFVLVGPFMHMYNRPEVEGVENIPTDGPAIMAGNHLSFSDWLFAPLLSPRRINYLAKAEYFTTPGFKGRLQKFFFSGTGQYPIDRSGASAAEDALNAATKLLDEGRLVGLYPEGTRSPDGRLYKGKTGMARLALETGVPVIPVAVIGTDKVSPPG